jgi:hypothetical protein
MLIPLINKNETIGGDDMEYKTADLSSETLKQLRQYEHDLSTATGNNIVLVAYEQPEDNTAEDPK